MLKYFQHKKYTGSIQFSKEDNCFFGKIININDLVSYEANSILDLKKAFIEAIEDYLETCKEIGK